MITRTLFLLVLTFSLCTSCFSYRYRNSRRSSFQQIRVYYEIDNLSYADFIYIAQAHRYFHNRLIGFFIENIYNNIELYQGGLVYVNSLKYIEEKYLEDDNNIILGNFNNVNGQNNVLKGSFHQINGNGNYVLNGQFPQHKIIGNNIVRIGRFDFDMDQIQKLISNPSQAVRILYSNY